MIDLSVIIPVYNAAPSINRTLDSIFNQQTSYAIEVILIDDGSKDNSIEIIKTRKEANITLLRQKTKDLLLPVTMGLRQHKVAIALIWMQTIIGNKILSKKLFHFWTTILIVWQ